MKKKLPSSHDAAGVFRCSRRTFLKRAALAGAAAVCPGALTGCNDAAAALKQKIAQMLLVGFRGTALSSDNPVARDISDCGIGGVVLYDGNISSPAQLKALNASLQALAAIPLFIAVDQEGGSVARLKESDGFPPTVSAQYLGDTNDLELTRTHAETMASTLALNGITVNFAPVVDLNVNPDNPVIGRLERSFSADPSVVTAHAREFIEAHDRNAVMTCLKHFPGHGSSAADSHEGFVDVTATWSPDELEPYRGLISEGRCRMVMTAHIFNRDLDPDYPATLSRQIITGMLREQLGFGGVVVTDDIQMEAIAATCSYAAAVEKAILAGVDSIMVANNYAFDPEVVPQTIDLLLQLVRNGTITEKRIDASYDRIRALKESLAGTRTAAGCLR